MGHTDDWDATFETKPDDDNYGYEIDDYLRELKLAIRERFAVDHYIAVAGTQASHGEHLQISFYAPITKPTYAANKGFLYVKDVDDVLELHFLDEEGNELQITSGGGYKNVTQHYVVIGGSAGFASIVGLDGQIIVGVTDGAPVFATMSGGLTLSKTGVLSGAYPALDYVVGDYQEGIGNTATKSETLTTYQSSDLALIVVRNGTLRIKFDLKSSSTGKHAYGKIYINGEAAGTERDTTSTDYTTYSEDIEVEAGDLIEVYLKAESGYTATAHYLYVYCANPSIAVRTDL